MNLIENINKGQDFEKELKEFWILTLEALKPYSFDSFSPNNKEIQLKKSFEGLCINIQSQTGIDPRNKTIFEFYSIIEFLSSKNQKAE